MVHRADIKAADKDAKAALHYASSESNMLSTSSSKDKQKESAHATTTTRNLDMPIFSFTKNPTSSFGVEAWTAKDQTDPRKGTYQIGKEAWKGLHD